MKQNKPKLTILTAILAPLAIVIAGSAYFSHKTTESQASPAPIVNAANSVSTPVSKTEKYEQNHNEFADQPLNPIVLKQAMKAYRWALASGEVHNKKALTIVDFSLPSNMKRLWVINPQTGQVLLNLHTAQGKNTGLKYATHFSNTPESKASSLGAYVTANVYIGKHGESMRLTGLEKGINNNAMSRDIVVHPANYVTPSFIKAEGRAGRSWGCFAVNPNKSKELISLTRGNSVLFAYAAPEKHDPNFG